MSWEEKIKTTWMGEINIIMRKRRFTDEDWTDFENWKEKKIVFGWGKLCNTEIFLNKEKKYTCNQSSTALFLNMYQIYLCTKFSAEQLLLMYIIFLHHYIRGSNVISERMNIPKTNIVFITTDIFTLLEIIQLLKLFFHVIKVSILWWRW